MSSLKSEDQCGSIKVIEHNCSSGGHSKNVTNLSRLVTTMVLAAQTKKKLQRRYSQHFLPKSVSFVLESHFKIINLQVIVNKTPINQSDKNSYWRLESLKNRNVLSRISQPFKFTDVLRSLPVESELGSLSFVHKMGMFLNSPTNLSERKVSNF